MMISKKNRSLLVLSTLICLLFAGCTTPKTLYQWESYQPQVYEYFKGQGDGPEAQLIKLEEGLQKIRATGSTPPPGYHAHLGLLYSEIGKIDQVVQEFRTEKELYPEATTYMDFLLKNIEK